jgi:hypothetical protein
MWRPDALVALVKSTWQIVLRKARGQNQSVCKHSKADSLPTIPIEQHLLAMCTFVLWKRELYRTIVNTESQVKFKSNKIDVWVIKMISKSQEERLISHKWDLRESQVSF